jgi:hypothetical protein
VCTGTKVVPLDVTLRGLAPLLRRVLVLAAIVFGGFLGGMGGLMSSVLVLGVAARVGEVSTSVALLFTLVGTLAGGTLGWRLARRPSGE